jgi:nucleotide-binding universal stress UspA family protein
MTSILAAIDTSPAAGPVLQSATTLAATLGVDAIALHALHGSPEPAHLLAQRAGVPLRLSRSQPAADAILQALADDQVLLAVIGPRGHPRHPAADHSGPPTRAGPDRRQRDAGAWAAQGDTSSSSSSA